MIDLWTTNNETTLLTSGEAYFKSLFNAIDGAERLIHIELYSLDLDQTGRLFLDHLMKAAKRGVQIRMILDGLGSQAVSKEEYHRIRSSGIEVKIYRPFLWMKLVSFFFRRLHRKSIVIDGRIAFVGGLNIGDEYHFSDLASYKMDLAIRVEGPAAENILSAMQIFWLRLNRRWASALRIYYKLLRRQGESRLIAKTAERVCYRTRSDWMRFKSIENGYRDAIRRSNQSILIAQAYFFPSLKLRRDLLSAARRGIHIKILLQGESDVRPVKWAESMLYREFILAGVEIYEFQDRYLHAKAAVVDQKWITVGSSNLDPWSLKFNLEGNLFIENSRVCDELHSTISDLIQERSKKINLDDVEKMSLGQKILGKTFYWLLSL